MENLNREERDLVLEALNQYWNEAIIELGRNDLGTIERQNWYGIEKKCGELLRKLGSF
jgi:hypothetical protein